MLKRSILTAGTLVFSMFLTPVIATAATQGSSEPSLKRSVDIRTWKMDEATRSGWSAQNLLDTKVIGRDGKEIGEVENLIIGPDDKVRKLIISTGGFLDIGDKHLSVPWNEVKISEDVERVTVPIAKENVNQYGLWDNQPERATKTGPREWRVTELLGDYAYLKGDVDYGYVRDVIISKDGQVKAVIISPDIDYGVAGNFAYPYYGYGYGWDPGMDYYDLPYGRDDIAGLDPYVY